MTEAELQVLCAEWQARLGLRDWTFALSVRPRRRMLDAETMGQCQHNLAQKIAYIAVADPAELDGEWGKAFPLIHDPEHVLVHELIHPHFAPFRAEPGTPEHVAQEQAINALATALVTLKREAQSTAKTRKLNSRERG